MILLSSFSFSMISEFPVEIKAKEISLEEVKKLAKEDKLDFKIGHSSYATLLSEMLEIKILPKREKVTFTRGEKAIVAQIITDRLPEGKVLTEEELKRLQIRFIEIQII